MWMSGALYREATAAPEAGVCVDLGGPAGGQCVGVEYARQGEVGVSSETKCRPPGGD